MEWCHCSPRTTCPFGAECMLIFGLWVWRWRHARWGRFLTTIEHESLHAIVGMLTLIPVRELKVREDGSGHVLFEPPGHWVAVFGPLFHAPPAPHRSRSCALIGPCLTILKMPSSAPFFALSLLGHLQQFHPRQTDFRHAGIVFTIAFLPTAFPDGLWCCLHHAQGRKSRRTVGPFLHLGCTNMGRHHLGLGSAH